MDSRFRGNDDVRAHVIPDSNISCHIKGKRPLNKAFRSPFDKLRVSGMPSAASVFPRMLNPSTALRTGLSKYERGLLQRAAKPGAIRVRRLRRT